MSTLYLVATPIGNLEDVTLRALRVLGEVSLIAAEDTRTTRKLLRRYNIQTSLVSYYEGNHALRVPYLLERLTQGDVALVSEAGTPGIRDPGRELIHAAIQEGINVVPLPGPSAIPTALAVAGFPSDEFLFVGFLPRRRKERRRYLERTARMPYTIVAFEAPHRLRASLEDMVATFGADRRIVVCRELTKMYEEIYHGTLSEAMDHFQTPRGEFTLVIAGGEPAKVSVDVMTHNLRDFLSVLREAGLSAKDAVSLVARQQGVPRRRVYEAWLNLKHTESSS